MALDWLPRALEESRARGFLSPLPIEVQIAHAEGFALVWESRFGDVPRSFLDLGSGGGLPGLVLAGRWTSAATLLDSMQRRCTFLREVSSWEGAPAGIDVVHGRAEDAARRPDLDEAFDLVTARSFGPPAVTAECAVRFVRVGGAVIVSDPPEGGAPERWPEEPLDQLGLATESMVVRGGSFQLLVKLRATDPRFPRDNGRPGRRPLF